MRILMVGDVVGQSGRTALGKVLPSLHAMHSPHFVVVNGENATNGRGITPHHAQQILQAGAHVITLGNHTWDQREIIPYLESEPRILRPANYPAGTPGRGWGIYMADNGMKIGVANVMGRVLMDPLEDPFRMADQIVDDFRAQSVKISVFDFHAEATSEKEAFGYYLDGRTSVVAGTHTHVQTADSQILPGGTGYITDIGMTGPQHAVLGMSVDLILKRFLTQMPSKFEVADGEAMINGIVADIDPQSGRVTYIERIFMRDIH